MITRLDTNGEGIGLFLAQPAKAAAVWMDPAGNALLTIDGTPDEPVITLGMSHQRATVVRLANAATAPVIIRWANGSILAVVWPDGRVTREEI